MEFKTIMGKAALLCAVAFASACSQNEFDEVVAPESGTTTLRLSAVGFTGETRLTRAAELKNGEDKINGVWVAQFADGKIIKGPGYYTVGSDNTVEAELDTEASNVYVVANVASDLFSSFDQTKGTEADFKATAINYASEITCDGTTNFLPMVGVKAITANDTQVNVTLTRAVARIDFSLTHAAADKTTYKDLTLTDCWLEYVPNVSSIEEHTAGATRVYPSPAADEKFFGHDAADDKAKFIYGKQSLGNLAEGGSKDISWYVPENLAGQNAAIDASKHKGAKTAPDKYAMRIVVKGTCTYKSEPNVEVSFIIYPGQNAITDFNVQRNYVYTVSSTIKGLNLTDNRVTVHDFVDLSAGGTANCYMIHEAGKYKFKYTVPGNGKIYRGETTTLIDNSFNKTSLSGNGVEVLWQGSGSSYGTAETVIKNVNIDGDYITFETVDSFKEGNALIALKNGDATVWSWHIWATNYTPKDDNSNVDTYTLDKNYAAKETEYVMRCNLGATGQGDTGFGAETTAPQCYGMTYQWGRKDPFYGTNTGTAPSHTPASNKDMVSETIANPTEFYTSNATPWDWYRGNGGAQNNYLWGNGDRTDVTIKIVHGASGTTDRTVNKQRGSKSVFDPCPVGWRVPPQGLWTNCGITSVASNYVAQSGATPAYLKLLQHCGRTVNYPAAGYLYYASGDVTNVSAHGVYWSSSPYSSEVGAGSLGFYSGGVCPVGSDGRAHGFSVRCVRE